ncbi:MAG TPA: YbaK/EbsC family protein [Pirellulales bacterium]|nr:YbaK/EbsC family protein [Pirellulales bacterium]
MKVQQFLDSRGISFEMLPHEPTFSAQRMAQAVHVSGDNVAKTVLLKADGQFVLAVLPATHQIHLEMAREALAAHLLELADEDELAKVFSDCEVGAVPPFGTQYGIETLVDASLAEDDEIVFEGNAHRQAFRMKYRDFEDLENPQVAVFGYHQC